MSQFKFELESQSGLLPKIEIIEPVGWDSNKPTLTRDQTYHGVLRSFTIDLTFVRDGYQYLKELYEEEGVMCDCLIYIYEYNNSKHEYELQDTGKIDFSTWNERDTEMGVNLTITDTRFIEKIRAREDTEVNYNNSVDLDGNEMSEPVYVEQEIIGAEVISTGNLEVQEQEVSFAVDDLVPLGSFWTPSITYAGQIAGGKTVTSRYINSDAGFFNKETDAFFLAETDNSTIIIEGRFNFDFFVNKDDGMSDTAYVALRKAYADSGSTLIKNWVAPSEGQFRDQELDISGTYTLNKGEALYILVRNGNEAAYDNTGNAEFFETEIKVVLKDQAYPTISKGAFLFDCFNRTFEALTGVPNTLTSSILGDGGEYHDYTLQNGLLIRNYEPDKAAMSWKLKDLYQQLDKIFNIGIAIGDNKTEIRKKKDFYRDGVIHTVTQSDIEEDSFSREIDTDYYFSDIEIGYTKSAYEEISGLEEYNNQSFYNTFLSVLNNKLEASSTIRGDIYGIEFARRMQADSDETEDSQYDSDNFLLNVVEGADGYKQLTTEGFTNVSGIDQISTPGNLNITPARNLRRWGWLIATGLQKYQDKKILFNKSDFESDLETTKSDGTTVKESESVEYSELEAPIFTGHKLLFAARLSFSDYNKIKASPYQIIKVWNPIAKEYTYGWIKEVGIESVDKSTSWELIEAISATEVLKSWLWNDEGEILWNDGGAILLNDQS